MGNTYSNSGVGTITTGSDIKPLDIVDTKPSVDGLAQPCGLPSNQNFSVCSCRPTRMVSTWPAPTAPAMSFYHLPCPERLQWPMSMNQIIVVAVYRVHTEVLEACRIIQLPAQFHNGNSCFRCHSWGPAASVTSCDSLPLLLELPSCNC